MRKTIAIFVMTCLISGSCSTQNNNNSNTASDTIKEKSSIKIAPPNNYEKKVEDLYKSISENKIDEVFFKTLDDNFSEKILQAILWDERNMNKMTLLFFLKLHYNQLSKNSKYGYNVSCCRNEFSCLMLFSLQFYKMSKLDPREILLTYYIYEWVLTQPQYLENKIIKKEIDVIKEIISEKKIEYLKHLKLKDSMFNK